jgi:hypothetical protein
LSKYVDGVLNTDEADDESDAAHGQLDDTVSGGASEVSGTIIRGTPKTPKLGW